MSVGLVFKRIFFLSLVLGVACGIAGCKGELRPTHADAKKAFAELVEVQEAHQQSIADLAIGRGPAYADLIRQDTALTLKRWRLRRLQFEYLIDHEPQRLRLRRGREGLVSFDWTPADSTNLANANPEYPGLSNEIDVLESWLQTHKDEEARLFFDSLGESVAMKALYRAYARDEQAIVLRYRLAAILKEEP